jgi:glycerol-1-phosphate dehydrogenase [NAD(P)+]
MNQVLTERREAVLEKALLAAPDTQVLQVEAGVRHKTANIFGSLFGSQRAVIVADQNTYRAAGHDVGMAFTHSGRHRSEIILGPHCYAEHQFVDELYARLAREEAIPIAVGSGTINDLTKLAAHRLNRPYMIVATAASMDGYTAYGASITYKGSKQTFDCPAPLAVLADLEVIASAPVGMNASGYADLLAKNVAGADWIVADGAGVEPIDIPSWETVQGLLPTWVGSPHAIALNDSASLLSLVHGLMMSGFAMQALRSSRPASGADHQFSHLWDMEHHTHNGKAPSHGFKVGIGTLASLALFEDLLSRDLGHLDVDRAVAAWPPLDTVEKRIAALFGPGELADKAREETAAKYLDARALQAQLVHIREGWPELRKRLVQHLIPFREVRRMLREAGCPSEPEEIGITRERLRVSYQRAYYIRRRFTVLDLASRTGLADAALENLFGPKGVWSTGGSVS